MGLAATGYGAYSYTQQASALDSAVEVNVSVTDTGIEEYSGRRDTDYGPVVTFEYAYEGETYTSSNVYPGRSPGSSTPARPPKSGSTAANPATP